MITQSPFVISWVIVFVVLGVAWYCMDRLIGVTVYRWFYDMTHKDPLPATVERGFVYNQKARSRLTTALVLSAIQSVLAVRSADSNLFLELFTFFLEIPAMMLGFYLGPTVHRIWERKDGLLDTFDKIESGETTIRGELKDASQRAAAVVREAIVEVRPDQTEEDVPTLEQEAPAPEAAAPPKQEEPADPRQLMSRYLKGRQSDEPGRN